MQLTRQSLALLQRRALHRALCELGLRLPRHLLQTHALRDFVGDDLRRAALSLPTIEALHDRPEGAHLAVELDIILHGLVHAAVDDADNALQVARARLAEHLVDRDPQKVRRRAAHVAGRDPVLHHELALATPHRHRLREAVEERAITRLALGKGLFGLAQVGDVMTEGREPDDPSLHIQHRAHADIQRARARLLHIARGPAVAQHLIQDCSTPIDDVRPEDLRHVPPDHLLRRRAKSRAAGFVRREDDALRIDQDRCVGRRVHEGARSLLALAQRHLDPLPLRNLGAQAFVDPQELSRALLHTQLQRITRLLRRQLGARSLVDRPVHREEDDERHQGRIDQVRPVPGRAVPDPQVENEVQTDEAQGHDRGNPDSSSYP